MMLLDRLVHRTGFALLLPGVSVKVPKFFRFNLYLLRRIHQYQQSFHRFCA